MLESVEHGVCSSSIEGKRCKFGYHLKGTKVNKISESIPKDKPKSSSRKQKNTDPASKASNDTDETSDDSTKEIMKDFLVSVVRLISGIKKEKEDKVKKKKNKDNSVDLLKNLAELLN